MKRNVYSLILSEDVVAAVDRLAYQQNTNRSNMINQILAEYVSYTTPEKRMQQILKQVEEMLHGHDTFQVMLGNSSDSMLSLRSALAYKYNPTVRYSVELYRNGAEGTVGVLKVSLRTQNANLILTMQRFYELWVALEQHYLATGRSYSIEGGRMTRQLYPAKQMTEQQLGQMIAHYVQILDQSMKTYFYYLENPNKAIKEMEAGYITYLKNGEII